MRVSNNYKQTYWKEVQERIDRYERMARTPSDIQEQCFYAGKASGLKQALAIFNILNGDFENAQTKNQG